VGTAARINAAEIKNVSAADSGSVEGIRVLNHECAAGGSVQIGFDNDALSWREDGDAKRNSARGVCEIDRAASVSLNRIGAGTECQRLRSIQHRIHILQTAGDIAIAISNERTDAGKKTAGCAVCATHGKS